MGPKGSLSATVTVFVYESTRWRTLDLPSPGRVALLAACGSDAVSLHLDRGGIETLQTALSEALAVLEKGAVSAA